MEISNLRPVPVYSTSTNVLNQPWGKFCFGKEGLDTFLNTSNPWTLHIKQTQQDPDSCREESRSTRDLEIQTSLGFHLVFYSRAPFIQRGPRKRQPNLIENLRFVQSNTTKELMARTPLCHQRPAPQLGCDWTIQVPARMMLRHLWLPGGNEPDIFDDSGDNRRDWASVSMLKQSGGGLYHKDGNRGILEDHQASQQCQAGKKPFTQGGSLGTNSKAFLSWMP